MSDYENEAREKGEADESRLDVLNCLHDMLNKVNENEALKAQTEISHNEANCASAINDIVEESEGIPSVTITGPVVEMNTTCPSKENEAVVTEPDLVDSDTIPYDVGDISQVFKIPFASNEAIDNQNDRNQDGETQNDSKYNFTISLRRFQCGCKYKNNPISFGLPL